MAKPIPFPLHLLSDESVEKLTPLQFGILMRFLKGFWENGTEIPKNQIQLYNYTRCYFKQWNRVKGDILVVWDKVIGGFKDEKNRRLYINAKNQKTALLQRERTRQRAQMNHHGFVDEAVSHDKISPVLSPLGSNWHQGTFDQSARQKAIQAKKDDDGKTFSD